ncbi:MAG: putative dynein heavy chain, partial [Streblomastix strix]
MHDNAELALQISEAGRIISSITMMQPRRSTAAPGAGSAQGVGGGAVAQAAARRKRNKKKQEEQKEEQEKKKQQDEEKKKKQRGKFKEQKKEDGEQKDKEDEDEDQQVKKVRTADDEVLDTAKSILDKLPPYLDKNEAVPGVLPVIQGLGGELIDQDAQGEQEETAETKKIPPSSLSIVLSQEMARFNKLMTVIRTSLDEVERAIGGLVVMSQAIEDVYDAILISKVPNQWADAAYPSLKPLGAWVADLIERILFFRQWLTQGMPSSFWFSGFFFPQGFLTAVLQTYARKYKLPIDTLRFKYQALKDKKDTIQTAPPDGVYIYGLFMEAASWDDRSMKMSESRPGEMYAVMPVLHFLPQKDYQPPPTMYAAPLYKTGA